MQLIRKKSLFLIISIHIILFLVLLTTSKQQFIPLKADLTQKLMALDLGFSSFGNLNDSGEGRLGPPLSQKLITLINSTPRIFEYKLFNESKFERIDIDIDFLTDCIVEEIPLYLFMGSRYNYNDRIKSNLHNILKEVGKKEFANDFVEVDDWK